MTRIMRDYQRYNSSNLKTRLFAMYRPRQVFEGIKSAALKQPCNRILELSLVCHGSHTHYVIFIYFRAIQDVGYLLEDNR